MILSKDELLTRVKERIGDDNSDEALKFVEDITDTVTDLDTKSKDQTDWEKKFKENDEQWRNKYKERFFNPDIKDKEEEKEEKEEKKTLSFDELFK